VKSCIVCHTPSLGTRCALHEREHARARELRRGTAAQRGYGGEWPRLSREAIAQHVEVYGWVCLGDGEHGAHPSHDLTADHRVAIVHGGEPEVGSVMCRAANSRAGARLRSDLPGGASRSRDSKPENKPLSHVSRNAASRGVSGADSPGDRADRAAAARDEES